MSFPQLLREASRILFTYDETAKLNLFDAFPAFKRFFTNRRNFAKIRTLGDLLFTVIIIIGLLGPQLPDQNISLFIAWGIWWTSVVLSWFFIGRMWCGFCPFPGIGRILRRHGLNLNLDVPKFLQKRGVYVSTFVLGIIIWVEAVFNLKEWPAGTAYLLLSIVAGATLMEMLYKGQSWCRHVCPMGRIIGSAATLSLTEFRPDHTICKGCSTIACKRGTGHIEGCPVYLGAVNVRNNLDCLVCGHCIPLCPHDSPRINLRNPFTELVINKGRYLTCSYIIPFLMGSQIARFIEEQPWYETVKASFAGSHLLAFTVLLAAGFVLFLGVIRIGARLFTVTEDEIFGRFSPTVPVLIPLAFAGELVYRLHYFLSGSGDVLPTFGREFGFDLSRWGFSIQPFLIHVLCLVVFILGAAASLSVLRLFDTGDFEGMLPRPNYVALNALVLLTLAAYLVVF